jgi:hypothetical protein
LEKKTGSSFKRFLEAIKPERFDAFLIFTADEFNVRLVKVAKKIKPSNKRFFFIRTKFDVNNDPGKGEKFDEKAILTKVRASLDEHTKELDCREYEIHLISNLHPYEWDFLKLTKAVVDALPSPQKECFSKIPKIQELIGLETFHNFMAGTM